MPRSRRILSSALVLALVFLPACSSPVLTPTAIKVADILNPTVQVITGDGILWGSGTIIYSEEINGEWVSYVLTAKHVIELSQGTKLSLKVRWWVDGRPYDYLATPSLVCPYEDLAILAVAAKAPAIAWAWTSETPPEPFTEVYIGGISLAEVPIPNKGEVGAYLEKRVLLSGHANPGYSGCGVYAWGDGHWRLIGVTVALGVQQGIPLHHLTMAIDWVTLSKWLADQKFDKLQK